ncbi:MAG: DUF5696 domain-containing protein [Thermoanaerobacteraceae bacterium]
MFKKIISVLILLAIILSPMFIKDKKNNDVYAQNTNEYFNISSNNYTQVENFIKLNHYNSEVGSGYTKIGESNDLELYFNEKNLSFKIKNKSTGYIWDSNLENTKDQRLNDEWIKFATSPVDIYYYDKNFNKKQATLHDDNAEVRFNSLDNGIKLNINFKDINISFDIYISISKNYLSIKIPDNSIKDKNEILASIEVLPFLGAVKSGEANGYMFIPDGTGALIRFKKNNFPIDEPYVKRVYGDDLGISESNQSQDIFGRSINNPKSKDVQIPVYGMIHNISQDGYLTIIRDGAEYSNIVCYPGGVSTDFNWITSEFIYRDKYFQPISRNMDGFLTYQKERNKFDINLRYVFLSNENADYVGMAKEYQKYLIENGLLVKNIKQNNNENIPARVELFGGEVKKGLFWNSIIPMSTVEQSEYILNDLKAQGVTNILPVYKGTTKGGFTGTLPQIFPFDKKLGNERAFVNFYNGYKNTSLYTDFTTAYKSATGYNNRTDIVYKINKRPIQFKNFKNEYEYFYLSPIASQKIFLKEKINFTKYGINSIAVDKTPFLLFSDYLSGNFESRHESVKTYQTLFDEMHKDFKEVSLYKPNNYLFKYANNYFDIPMYSSQYIYETDTVPFLQILLRGYIDLFAPISNNYADMKEETLRMIEFGVYPSILFTYQPPYLLIDTPSKNIISSQYSELKSLFLSQYKEVNNALKYVKGQSISSREILNDKVVKVDYTNGISIIVNYNDNLYNYKGKTIEGKSYLILGGDTN